jgi:hypothetical protein
MSLVVMMMKKLFEEVMMMMVVGRRRRSIIKEERGERVVMDPVETAIERGRKSLFHQQSLHFKSFCERYCFVERTSILSIPNIQIMRYFFLFLFFFFVCVMNEGFQ